MTTGTASARQDRVRERFTALFSSSPAGLWSAPGRVNLIGEHTDYNNGLVLPVALPQRTYAACGLRDDDVLRVHSVQTDEGAEVDLRTVGPGSPSGWASYVAGVLWALRGQGHPVRGMDVVVDSDVPVGAGLSSSAALECAVGAAASDLFGLGLLEDDTARGRLATACIRAENEVAGAMTGGMDQSAALLCREGHALLLDCRSGAAAHIPFDLAAYGDGHVLLVTDTRAAHSLNDGQYESRRRACESAAAALGLDSLREIDPRLLDGTLRRLDDDVLVRRVRHVVSEIARVRATVTALEAHDLAAVGRLFDDSHASLRDDYEVSCDELDLSVETARRAGALGARMTGGGFGGASIAIVRADRAEPVERAVSDAFAARGWVAPRSFAVTAGGAARRDA